MYYRTPKAIGEAIRKRRRALEMTQADRARRTGVSHNLLPDPLRIAPREKARIACLVGFEGRRNAGDRV